MLLIFPYRPQIRLQRWPIATLAIVLVCLVVYFVQDRNFSQIERVIERVCAQDEDPKAYVYPFGRYNLPCQGMLWHTYFSSDPEAHFRWHHEDFARRAGEEIARRYEKLYRAFVGEAPPFYTARLWHDRPSWNLWRMLTSSVAHASWDHVIFNLFFFFAFASIVELVIGPVLFLACFVLLAFGIGGFDNIISRWTDDPGPTLGLSGIVSGMMGLAAYFVPRVKIRFFFWFIISIGFVALPLWFVGLWYVGWDLYYQLRSTWHYVNYVAHLSGAAFGLALGLAFFRTKRHWAQSLVLMEKPLSEDETWTEQFNTLMVAGGFAAYLYWTVALPLLVLAIYLVEHFGAQMLMAAPALAAGYRLYRSRREVRPDWMRFKEAQDLIQALRHEEAAKILQPLAERGYPRAQLALARLYAAGIGVIRDERLARHWYEAAAARGHAEAQYALGARYADGYGVERDVRQAVAWYEQAAHNGLPEAAASLGYLYEQGAPPALEANTEKAIEWYHRAARGYLRAGRREDAEAMLRHLEALAAGYPAVLGLVAELRSALRRGR